MKYTKLRAWIVANAIVFLFSINSHAQIAEVTVTASQRPISVGTLEEINLIFGAALITHGDTLARDIQDLDDAEEACEEAIELDRMQCEINVLDARMDDYAECSRLLLIPSAQIEIEFDGALAAFRGTLTTVGGAEISNACTRDVDRLVEFEMKDCALFHNERAMNECRFFGG